MIISYDDRFNLTPDQKILSLKENIQLALNEQSATSERLYRSLLSALGVNMTELRGDFSSLSERLEEEAQALSDAIAAALERLDTVEEIAEKVDPILSDLSSLKTRMTSAETNIGTLQSNYTALEARVTALEQRVTALENE